MGDYKPQVGDHVRVVLEGEVTSTPNYCPDFKLTDGNGGEQWVQPQFAVTASVEKIEPPVEVFEVGARIRRVWFGPYYEVTIGNDGYLHHQGGRAEWRNGATRFTSKHYERVTLS